MAVNINKLSSVIICRNTSSGDILNILLKNRNINTKNRDEFLKPSPPKIKLNISDALRIIQETINNNGNVLIYGDYDVDGISATAIIWQTLYKKTPNVVPFVPNRFIDGYGFNSKTFFRLQKVKNIIFDLLITVDNGIVAGKEFRKIKSKQKIKIIVIDHHLDNGKLVAVDSLVHSTLYSASAIAWFLAKKLDLSADIGLAAMGTVTDCIPLIGTNRSLVVNGLISLRLNPPLGIKKLLDLSGINSSTLTVYELAYVIGPRINAIGRLSDPTDALRLLCSQNINQATKYAGIVNIYNQQRQDIQKINMDKALSLTNIKDKLLFIFDSSFNPGVIGLIAGRLTDKFNLPSIVISIEGLIARGSCRSIPEINIIELLRQHSDLFLDLGGHTAAAGFSILTKNISKLKKLLMLDVKKLLKNIKLESKIQVDAEMKLSAVNEINYNIINQLSPFGIGNPEPIFIFNKLRIISIQLLGKKADHLKLKLDDPDTPQIENIITDAIAFNKGDLSKDLQVGDLINIVASINLNVWNGNKNFQLVVKEIVLD